MDKIELEIKGVEDRRTLAGMLATNGCRVCPECPCSMYLTGGGKG